jgi:DNA-binding NarL/FixJ family response regulator
MRTRQVGPEDAVVSVTRAYARARGLSARETAVFLKFVVDNLANKEIAAELEIAYPTVKVYWSRIFLKLGCENEAGAMLGLLRFAICHCQCCHCHDDIDAMA